MAVRIIAGLGNPGPKYARHRHNLGFMVLDLLAAGARADAFRAKFQGSFAKARVGGQDVVLLKPGTYMNLSGRSLQEAMRFFKVTLPEVVVVHDELDLPFGTVRIKIGGGTAGHNGLKSIVECCGGADFVRLRIGIGRPRSGSVERHVLADFSSEESAFVPDVLERATAALGDIVARGPQAAMNAHNRSPD